MFHQKFSQVVKASAYLAASFVFFSSTTQAATTLESVKQRGHLVCGVNTSLLGFSSFNKNGEMEGLDVDLCKAIAAGIFGDKNKVSLKPLSASQRFTALQSGEVDVLTRNTTRTLSRDSQLGLDFGPVNFYDGQRFMVRKELNITHISELDGASICIQQGTTTEQNIADYFRAHDLEFEPVVFEDINEAKKAFFSKRCDAYTGDGSEMASVRMESTRPADYMLLEEVISKEPLAPVVRHGDDQWLDIVSYSLFAMIDAEELGINSANVDNHKESANPKVQRLLGVTKGNGEALGLPEDFAYQIIKQIGNYSESYEKNIGPLEIPRGLNQLWTDGGLMYSPPFK